MIDKKKIIELISEIKTELGSKYGFKSIILYGSFAKDKGSKDSDIDIAVEVDDTHKTWKNYIAAKDDLKSLLGHEIDLVYLDSMNPIIKNNIEEYKVEIE